MARRLVEGTAREREREARIRSDMVVESGRFGYEERREIGFRSTRRNQSNLVEVWQRNFVAGAASCHHCVDVSRWR